MHHFKNNFTFLDFVTIQMHLYTNMLYCNKWNNNCFNGGSHAETSYS